MRLEKYFNKRKFIEKEIKLVVIRVRGWGEVELEEGGWKAQTSSYKINNHVMYSMMTIANTAVGYIGKLRE